MITILVGEDTAASRQSFSQLRETYEAQGYEISSLSADQITGTIAGDYDATGLFHTNRVFFAENVLSKKVNRDALALFDNIQRDRDLVVWEEAIWESQAKYFFKKAQVKNHPLPTSLFAFLDSVVPGKKVEAIAQLRAVSETSEPIMLLVMLQRRVRELIMASDGVFDPKKQSWQRSRLQSAVRSWPKPRLLTVYKALYTIESKTKKGTSGYDIVKSLELLFAYYL